MPPDWLKVPAPPPPTISSAFDEITPVPLSENAPVLPEALAIMRPALPLKSSVPPVCMKVPVPELPTTMDPDGRRMPVPLRL